MGKWKTIEPMTATFEVSGDFTDWLKDLEKTSINEIDVIGLHDKTIDKKREFVALDRVLEIIDDVFMEVSNGLIHTPSEALEETHNRVKALRGE